MFFLTALALGFLGSFHCIGMCGPIALAVPLKNRKGLSRLAGAIIYNSGRVMTYFIIGFAFGLLGRSIALAGYQNALSVCLGVLILLFLFFPHLAAKGNGFVPNFLSVFYSRVKSSLSALFTKKSNAALFSIGLLNALLPCGLVYMALMGSLATGHALEGAFFMAGFGLGTLPAMLLVSLSQSLVRVSLRSRINRAVPVFVGVMAFMLILRGMNLGIPYLSPKVITEQGQVKHRCCSKPKNQAL